MSLPMNPVVDGDCDGDSDNGGAEEEAEGSPLGVKILEGSGTRRRKAGAASPTDAVMYEVRFNLSFQECLTYHFKSVFV